MKRKQVPAASICPVCYRPLERCEAFEAFKCVNPACWFDREVSLKELYQRSVRAGSGWRRLPVNCGRPVTIERTIHFGTFEY